jgi:hypothetical protein
MRIDPEIIELEKVSHSIVTLICSEQVADGEIDQQIARLRDRTTRVFPERPDVFERTFGRRFKRLRTRFQPRPGLFSGS